MNNWVWFVIAAFSVAYVVLLVKIKREKDQSSFLTRDGRKAFESDRNRTQSFLRGRRHARGER